LVSQGNAVVNGSKPNADAVRVAVPQFHRRLKPAVELGVSMRVYPPCLSAMWRIDMADREY